MYETWINGYSLFTGPLASTGVDGLAFVSTKLAYSEKHSINKDWPDIEMHMVPADVVADGGRYFKQLAGLSEKVSTINKVVNKLNKQQNLAAQFN